MRKEFSLSNDKATINFTAKYCDNYETLLESDGFRRVLEAFLKQAKKKNTHSFRFLEKSFGKDQIPNLESEISNLFKVLTVLSVEEISHVNPNYSGLLLNKDEFIAFVEDLYLFWRKLERYTIIYTNRVKTGLAAVSFTEVDSQFSRLIRRLYRRIEKNVLGYSPNVFRQLPVGGNASLMLSNVVWAAPDEYRVLEDIPFIDSILLQTPFITYPKKNTRDGMFKEVKDNPLKKAIIDKDHWFCYPAKIGDLLAFLYFHRDFMEHGITLCNLFELAKEKEFKGKKPDIIYVYGAREKGDELKTVFYDDKDNDIMFGYINHSEEIDYFGYMKKMSLTLHNLIQIKRGYLPIHGAMVNIVLKNGKEANVIIMGDSGAGKSESLEAFRGLSEDYISDMTIVFDDMGTIKEKDGSIYGYGTEIGAFVRLDDLDQGYAFKEMDRSIFMNPDKINARLVMPVASYKEIMKGYKVDLFLYANNYDEVPEGGKAIEYFETSEDAIKVFKAGARVAKGTTTEKGLVKSYFANPFGPAQKQQECDILLDKYFDALFASGVKVGEIKTSLAIQGSEKNGPRKAALELFNIINNL
ncbi:phosphoenolpyruvate carboxykinase [Clostridium sp. 'White wine YQ']|uniref:phosphoenolpyruvate carboxykinase n=1 Tax=Clostridium sp. 'White wine YQ' TaxID=3027474 RepID=UPI002366167C|nr:phosphoenolpyruvate carboxykinase [Clostridium sp. 'White wine YQ']MDD7793251.1 phosphoenolpyruvate carboxykinase [Clostridium sp. 'White wine YQ']